MSGPSVSLLPLLIKSSTKKKALSLGPLQYVEVRNSLDGKARIETGPQLLLLKVIVVSSFVKVCLRCLYSFTLVIVCRSLLLGVVLPRS